MAEPFTDYLGMDASSEHLGGVSVPQVMEADPMDTALPGNPGESVGDARRCQRCPIWVAKDKSISGESEIQLCSLCFLVLKMGPQDKA